MTGMIFTLQVCVFYSFYASKYPGNSEIYMDQFRNLLEFDMVKPDRFLQLYDPEWSVSMFLGLGQERLNGAVESTGVKTVNPTENMKTYLMPVAILLGVIGGAVAAFVFIMMAPKLLAKRKDKFLRG